MAKFDKRPASGTGSKKSDYKSKRSFSKNKSFREQKPDTERRNRAFNRDEKPFRKKSEGPVRERKSFERDGKAFEKKFTGRDKKFGERDGVKRSGDASAPPPFRSKERGERPAKQRDFGGERSYKRSDEKERSFGRDKKFTKRRDEKMEESASQKKHYKSGERFERPEKPRNFEDEKSYKRHGDRERPYGKDKKSHPGKSKQHTPKSPDELIRLNKYLSNAGIASRREADVLIQSGAVKVNGVVVDQLGYKIKPGDKVTYGDQSVKSEKKVYLLLNKPKDYITTMDDPRERKTVMDLIKGACRERVYPVGRLDRNTTGVLLFTNDGEMTTRLTHPKFGIKKVYQVTLNRSLKAEDYSALTEGIELEDGPIKADDLAFVGEGRKEVGVEIHSGRNRIVRRMFEHLGYEVIKLDRVVFAGLTKKDLPRGKWRFLNPKEVNFLHMLG